VNEITNRFTQRRKWEIVVGLYLVEKYDQSFSFSAHGLFDHVFAGLLTCVHNIT
jgi:hypothetical protein